MASKASNTSDTPAPRELATYIANQSGYLSGEGRFVVAGETFSTKEDVDSWADKQDAPATDSAGQADA
ncbi:hypothetical protein [Novosphingobium rosa]|uniref:hypothetical protein n=1 Tax=Novosphingobium rosa TaxID=76978 RepID=UPI00082A2C8F|nr:hypothetical protein [Novosphingobium rosa]